MRYINDIFYNKYGDLVIRGEVGTWQYLYYTKREAIKKYNALAKAARAAKKAR